MHDDGCRKLKEENIFILRGHRIKTQKPIDTVNDNNGTYVFC